LKPTVFLTRRIPSAPLRALEAACEVDRYDGPGELPHDELLARVAGKQGLVCVLNDTVGADVIAAGPELKVIANIAVGFNNVDVPAARARGIIVTNTPDVLTEASADHTWGLILGITRRIAEGDRLIRRGGWKAWGLDFMLGAELRGKQLGIVGFGRIGRAVAARAGAFGMHVVHTMRGKGAAATADGSVVAMPLDQLLATSDVVSLHVPLTPETRHLIDQPALARMKRSAYLINTSRGPVVDEEALGWALRERMISGAALDVFEREPEVHRDLLALENVLLVPHLASATVETRTAMADLAVRNAIAVLSGQPPVTPVP
jgi:glyoxylate reductase